MRSFILFSFLSSLGVMGLNAQTWAERVALANALNNANPGLTYTSVPIGGGAYGDISLRQLDGSCGPPFQAAVNFEPTIEFGKFRFNMLVRPTGNTLELVKDAHLLVCDLNSWINFNVVNRSDFWLNDTANANLNFTTACDSESEPPEFFMANANASGCGLGFGGNDMGRIGPWKLYRRYYAMVRSGGVDYLSEDFWSERLCRPYGFLGSGTSQGTYPIFIGRRNQPWTNWQGQPQNGATLLHRAHSVLQFDYRYYSYDNVAQVSLPDAGSDDQGNYGAYADSTYVLPWLADANKMRLDSIVYVARTQAYTSDECDDCTPTPSSTFGPRTDQKASRSVLVYFTENVGLGTQRTHKIQLEKSYHEGDADENNLALWENRWNVADPNSYFNPHGHWMTFEMDADGNVYLLIKGQYSNLTGHTLPSAGNLLIYVVKVRTDEIPTEQCDIVLPVGGQFAIDDMTGSLVYNIGGQSTRIHCLDFCDPITSDFTVANVLSAGAQSFSDQWEHDPDADGDWIAGEGSPYRRHASNDFEKGVAGKWRPKGAWAYRSELKPASFGDGRVYDKAGVFVDGTDTLEAFHLFNWVNEPSTPSVDEPSWLNATTVTRYAPSGEPVEERNILGIYSAAKLAHNNTVPLLVAQNAQYDVVDFESFEEHTTNPSVGATFNHAHAGRTSYKLNSNGTFSDPLLTLRLTNQLAIPVQDPSDLRGLVIKFWVKRTYLSDPPIPPPIPPPPVIPVKVRIKGVNEQGAEVDVLTTTTPFDQGPSTLDSTYETKRLYKVAQTGEWTLYQLIVDNFRMDQIGTKFTVKLARNPMLGPDDVWIDDIRAQPIDAQMGCYVYDRDNLRLLAQFDDQHFALLYQYNGEGQLVRKLRETERGVKTVAETQYHTPLTGERIFDDGLAGPTLDPPDVYSAFADAGGLNGGMGSSRSGDFDLFQLRAGRDGSKVKFFGDSAFDAGRLKRLWSSGTDLSDLDQKALGAFAAQVPEMERLALLKELVELEADRRELADQVEGEAAQKAKEELQVRIDHLDARRKEILYDKLGLTEKEVQALYDELKKVSEEKSTETNDSE